MLNQIYPIVKDNRFNGHLLVDYDYETKKVVVRYNSRNLSTWSEAMIICGVFHELGHVKQGNQPYFSDEEKIFSERDAEEFALKMMKKYYTKKDLKEVVDFQIRLLENKDFKNDYPIHYEAFKKIKEYQN